MNGYTAKILLALIALGLWANLAVAVLRPVSAVAQYESDYILRDIGGHIANIDANIDKLQRGTCANGKLCLY